MNSLGVLGIAAVSYVLGILSGFYCRQLQENETTEKESERIIIEESLPDLNRCVSIGDSIKELGDENNVATLRDGSSRSTVHSLDKKLEPEMQIASRMPRPLKISMDDRGRRVRSPKSGCCGVIIDFAEEKHLIMLDDGDMEWCDLRGVDIAVIEINTALSAFRSGQSSSRRYQSGAIPDYSIEHIHEKNRGEGIGEEEEVDICGQDDDDDSDNDNGNDDDGDDDDNDGNDEEGEEDEEENQGNNSEILDAVKECAEGHVNIQLYSSVSLSQSKSSSIASATPGTLDATISAKRLKGFRSPDWHGSDVRISSRKRNLEFGHSKKRPVIDETARMKRFDSTVIDEAAYDVVIESSPVKKNIEVSEMDDENRRDPPALGGDRKSVHEEGENVAKVEPIKEPPDESEKSRLHYERDDARRRTNPRSGRSTLRQPSGGPRKRSESPRSVSPRNSDKRSISPRSAGNKSVDSSGIHRRPRREKPPKPSITPDGLSYDTESKRKKKRKKKKEKSTLDKQLEGGDIEEGILKLAKEDNLIHKTVLGSNTP